MPDDTLFTLAREGKLRDPGMLAAQAQRLLADRKALEMIEDFTVHWLELRNLPNLALDEKLFPELNGTLRSDLRNEAIMMVGAVMREDRSVMDLLSGDWTFLNERLAKLYGITGVAGTQWRKVALSDARRGGVLGLGAVMATTSYPTRTSVVQRGKWVLEQLLDQPPPPPPAMVEPLDKQPTSAGDGKTLSLRQRLERHRANPTCASCHKVMDAIGFGLDNFDPLGRWRERDAEAIIDSSGQLDGKAFSGPVELKKLLTARGDEFLRCLATKILTYAIGRRCDDGDDQAIAEIVRVTKAGNMRFSTLLTAVVTSKPFRFRQQAPTDATANQ